MLSPTLLVILALYPLISIAAPAAYFLLFPKELRSLPVLPLGAADEEEKASAARLGVNVPLTFYGLLVSCAILSLWSSQGSFSDPRFQFKTWVSAALIGGYFGLAWAGIWLGLWFVLSNPQRLRREVPGFGASFAKQVVVAVAGALAEELWRVLCITALLVHGYSAVFSVIAVALAFGLAFLTGGIERAILAVVEGAIFGILFVWQRSFLAPFTAHLAVQSVYLWGVGQFSPEGQQRSWLRGIRCPVCGAQLSRFQIQLREPFDCPSCQKQISVSDGYRKAMVWVATAAYIVLTAATLLLLDHQVSDTLAGLVLTPIAFGIGTSGWFLYQRIIPPQLQYGSPTFITLNLERERPEPSDSENKRDDIS